MDPETLRILMNPLAGAMDGGGGGAVATELAVDPTLNSLSDSGLSAEELAAPPSMGIETDEAGAVQAATPADPNLGGATLRQDATQPSAPSIRDAARHYGLDLSQYADDGQAFAALVQMANSSRQANYYAQLGQAIAPHYQGVQQYLQSQQQQAAKPAERQSWEAPEFDERWLQLVDKDPATGMYVAKPGVNPVFAEKVQQYADHLENWTTQLARNPMEALGPLVNHLAEQMLEKRFGQQQAVQQAQSIVAENEAWIYATDDHGRRLVGGDGRFVPTPLGARYYTHLQTLRASGVTDARSLDTLAKQLLQADLAASNAAKAGNQQGASSPQAAAAAGRPNVNPGQAVPPARRQAVPGATEPSGTGLSLREQLAQAMREEGITDADLMATYGS